MATTSDTVEPSAAAPKISGIAPKTKARPPPPPFLVPLNIAFSICLVAHALAASNAPIQDCDETFNYWEPLHYLTHGSGFQTWEYAPEFSIRSWAYILIHAIPVKIFSLLQKPKETEFYFLRCLLAFVCAATETRLYAAISRSLNPRIGVFYLVIVASTTGFFYASSAFLPSSFAMYTSTLGLTVFMDRRRQHKPEMVVLWFALGASLGWPFAGALIIPFVADELASSYITGQWDDNVTSYMDAVTYCLAIVGIQASVDGFFYQSLTVVPWRMVMYNIFGGKDRGPDIFGTEPWHFYVRNLLLNFNIWYVLAMCTAPLLAIQSRVLKQRAIDQSPGQMVTFVTPFYLWFTVFTLQPHKEERFMYPAYPFLALNAAISLHILLAILNHPSPNNPMSRLPQAAKTLLPLPILVISIVISLLRTLGTVTSYNAPLKIYQPLTALETLPIPITRPPSLTVGEDLKRALTSLFIPAVAPSNTTPICLGKDWYRFPSSFFLPANFRPHFIKSEFDGLLPGSFLEAPQVYNFTTGLFPGASMTTSPMNDRNEEDAAKYIDVSLCEYLVDSQFESVVPTKLEPDYIGDTASWEVMACEKFLDVSGTGTVGRLFWMPEWVEGMLGVGTGRVWGKHCLLRRRGGGK